MVDSMVDAASLRLSRVGALALHGAHARTVERAGNDFLRLQNRFNESKKSWCIRFEGSD